MRILITNNTLGERAGSEMYVHDLALALKNKSHDVTCYSPVLGEVARNIENAGVCVLDDLRHLSAPPDLIHAHHVTAAPMAFFTFPNTPAIFVCHGFKPWQETPLYHYPQIRRFVAVDMASRERLINDLKIGADDIQIIQNGVDTEKFFSKYSPAADPERPRRALVFSNYAQSEHVDIVRAACTANNITLDVLGLASGNATATPENVLGDYDLVFAKGRAALEALACGAIVMVSDYGKWGGAVSTSTFGELREKNFGLRALTRPLDANDIAAEIASLDWSEGEVLANMVREHASLEQMVSSLLSLYQDVLAEEELKGSDVHS